MAAPEEDEPKSMGGLFEGIRKRQAELGIETDEEEVERQSEEAVLEVRQEMRNEALTKQRQAEEN